MYRIPEDISLNEFLNSTKYDTEIILIENYSFLGSVLKNFFYSVKNRRFK